MVGGVVGDAIGDGGGGDIESRGDGGGAGHVGNVGFAGEEAGDGEVGVGEAKVGFSSLAVELGVFDAKVGIGRDAVGEGGFGAVEGGEVGIVGIVAVQNDDFGILAEEDGFGAEIGSEVGVGEAGGDEVGESGDGDGEIVEHIVFERGGGGGDDSVGGFGLPSIAEEFLEEAGLDGVVGGENSGGLAGGEEDFVDIVGDGRFAGGAGDADEAEVTGRVAVVGREEFGLGAAETETLGVRFGVSFCFHGTSVWNYCSIKREKEG